MSDAVYPLLPGLAWDVVKTPTFRTVDAQSDSGRQFTVSKRIYPTWTFRLAYEFLRAKGSLLELETLCGFILQRRGKFDDFLYRDPNDYLVAQQAFGVGDGVTTTFPLVRALGGFVEPVAAADNVTQVRIAGAAAAYGVGAGQWRVDTLPPNTRNIIFGSPPAPGQVLDWNGTFYYRCRFTFDAMEFTEFYRQLHKPGAIEFMAPRYP